MFFPVKTNCYTLYKGLLPASVSANGLVYIYFTFCYIFAFIIISFRAGLKQICDGFELLYTVRLMFSICFLQYTK